MGAAASIGMLNQTKALSIQRQPHAQITNGSNSSAVELKASPSQQRDDSQCAEKMESHIQLSEDILHHIHTLMPLRDAAQVAFVSPCFLRSWRCYPKLILNIRSLGIKYSEFQKDEITRDFIERVDRIMENHSGMGLKTFKLQTYPCSNLHSSYVDRWLQVALTPGIKEFELEMPFSSGIRSFPKFPKFPNDTQYSFPSSILSSKRISSIQSFLLAGCSFHHVTEASCMSSLTDLYLRSVHITCKELYVFLSNSCALKKIVLASCNDIICLKIPCRLQQLQILDVMDCKNLETIGSDVPNLSAFCYAGRPIHISLGDAAQVRRVKISRRCAHDTLYYASTKLPFIVPNVKCLVLSTRGEDVNTPKAFGKFVHLKHLVIVISALRFTSKYDFLSLISFLDASPALETFILHISHPAIRTDSIVEDSGGDSLTPRCHSECCHYNLKNVKITGFCSAKSMIELMIHVMEKTKSLECLTLDTTSGHDQKSGMTKCFPMNKEALVEAEKARIAI